jgi:hypothetical protein
MLKRKFENYIHNEFCKLQLCNVSKVKLEFIFKIIFYGLTDGSQIRKEALILGHIPIYNDKKERQTTEDNRIIIFTK